MMATAIAVPILIMKVITVAVKDMVAKVFAVVIVAISNGNESNGRNRSLKTEQ